ncbi:MAG: hypothetical protein J2P45_03255 [Candidatus Dormibacteraeota bacterium]|nr:hypothetical protein [Candidatus Dormibacteraeota bacterium]
MRRFWGLLNGPLIATTVGGVLTAGLISILSGHGLLGWLSGLWILRTIPLFIWTFLAGVVVTILVVNVWQRKQANVRRQSPERQRQEYEVNHRGVVWTVTGETPDDLSVNVPPRCPRCRTKLSEEPSFDHNGIILSWKWACVQPNCSYVAISTGYFDLIAPTVLLIAQREMELEQLRPFDPCKTEPGRALEAW